MFISNLYNLVWFYTFSNLVWFGYTNFFSNLVFIYFKIVKKLSNKKNHIFTILVFFFCVFSTPVCFICLYKSFFSSKL